MKRKTHSQGESTLVEGTRADSTERESTTARNRKSPLTHLEELKEQYQEFSKKTYGRRNLGHPIVVKKTCEAILKDIEEKMKEYKGLEDLQESQWILTTLKWCYILIKKGIGK